MVSPALPKFFGNAALPSPLTYPFLLSLGLIAFLISGIVILPLLGFEADEVMYVYDLWHPKSSAAWLSFFHHLMPYMLMSYVGALKSWAYVPILALAGPSTWAIRLPTLLLSCLTIYLAARLLRSVDGRFAALIAVWLLSTSMIFLLTAVLDWGPVVFQNLLLVAGLLLTERWIRQRRSLLLFAAGLIFGLALWDKALFLWNLSGMALALIIVNARAALRAFTVKSALLAVLGLCLGAYPLLRYNAGKGNSTVGQNAHFTSAEILNKARFLWFVVDDSSLATPLIDWEHPSLDHEDRPLKKLSLSIAGKTPAVSSSWRSWLVVIALPFGLIAADNRRRKWILFFTIAALISWLQSAVTINAGGSIHHTVLLWPLFYLALSLSLAAIAQLKLPVAKSLVIVIVAFFCFSGLNAINSLYANLLAFSPTVPWRNADVPLGRQLKLVGAHHAIVTDWGIAAVLAVRANDKISVDDRSWQLLDDRFDQDAFLKCKLPGCVIVSHPQGQAVMPKAAETLTQGLTAHQLCQHDLFIISDTHGTPSFRVSQVQPTPECER